MTFLTLISLSTVNLRSMLHTELLSCDPFLLRYYAKLGALEVELQRNESPCILNTQLPHIVKGKQVDGFHIPFWKAVTFFTYV